MRSIISISVVLLAGALAWAAEPATVRFKPFTEADASQHPDWITSALNQSVVDELASMQKVTVITPVASELQPASATSAGPATQTSGNFDDTVSGTIQRINQQIRVSGTVTDAKGKTVGGFKATGSEQDLFAIEDSVAEQLRATLGLSEQPPALPLPSAGAAGTSGGVQPVIGANYDGSDLQHSVEDPTFTRRLSDRSYYNNVVSSPPGVVVPSYTTPYGGGYYPPYYGGGWGWGWGPSVVIIDNGRNHHHHDGGGGTHRPNMNGQAIRRAATGAGGNIASQPQLVPSGGPQLVPSGGPQLVPGNPVPPGMGGGSQPRGAGFNMTGDHAPGAGFNTNPSKAPGAGHR